MNSNSIIQPQTSDNSQSGINTHKKEIIIIASIVVILVISITAIILILTHKKEDRVSSTTEEEHVIIDRNNENNETITYTKNSDYSEVLNVFANIHENIDVTTLQKVLDKAKNDLTIYYAENQTSGYIHNEAIQNIKKYCSDEYITFNIEKDDVTPDYSTIYDVTYHAPLSSGCSYIIRNADGTFRHFTGKITSDFDTLEEAIDDHLMRN